MCVVQDHTVRALCGAYTTPYCENQAHNPELFLIPEPPDDGIGGYTHTLLLLHEKKKRKSYVTSVYGGNH